MIIPKNEISSTKEQILEMKEELIKSSLAKKSFTKFLHNTDYYYKYGSLLILTIQNCSMNIVMRLSRTQKDLFISSTAVLISEILKLITCLGVIWFQEGTQMAANSIRVYIFNKPLDTLKLAVPSVIYYIQNNLLYLAATHLDAATNQVTYQLKILTTAMLSVVLLKKRLSSHQWLALLLLFVGVALVQLQQSPSKSSQLRGESPFIGFIAVFLASILSGFSGVYFEKILKSALEVSLWIRNIQLSALTLPFSIIQILITDSNEISEKGFFFGYSFIVWLVIFLQAIGGIICGLVVKYADNILKGFATSLAIVLSCIISLYAFDFHLNLIFTFGTCVVISSVYLYSKPSSPIIYNNIIKQ